MNEQSVIIDSRFRGPTHSANGGYTCGLVASAFNGPCQVTLKSPPSLDTRLTLAWFDDRAQLLDGDLQIASAVSVAGVDLDIPEAVSVEAARAASESYAGFDNHLYPECFVCGPRRDHGDGLRIFPGHKGGTYFSPWQCYPDLGDSSGRVRDEYVWAALDCPGYFGLGKPGLPALLGRMEAVVTERPMTSDTVIVAGWHVDSDGRKHRAGTALFGGDGRCMAYALSTWIELK